MTDTTRPAMAVVAWNQFLDFLRGDPEVQKRETKRGRVHIAKPGEPFRL